VRGKLHQRRLPHQSVARASGCAALRSCSQFTTAKRGCECQGGMDDSGRSSVGTMACTAVSSPFSPALGAVSASKPPPSPSRGGPRPRPPRPAPLPAASPRPPRPPAGAALRDFWAAGYMRRHLAACTSDGLCQPRYCCLQHACQSIKQQEMRCLHVHWRRLLPVITLGAPHCQSAEVAGRMRNPPLQYDDHRQ
jgi:hypothetical protein